MSEELPQVVKTGVIHLTPEHPIEVHVLDDGRRIITAESMEVFFDWLESPQAGPNTDAIKRLARALKLGEFDEH